MEIERYVSFGFYFLKAIIYLTFEIFNYRK